MDLTTNDIVISDAIKFVHSNEKLTMSKKEDDIDLVNQIMMKTRIS